MHFIDYLQLKPYAEIIKIKHHKVYNLDHFFCIFI